MYRKKGVRERSQRNSIKLLPLLMALAVLLSLPAFPGVWATAVEEKSQNQVVVEGESLYYTAEGAAATAENHALHVSKTVTQKTGEENRFKVNLEVTTKTDYQQVIISKDSAVVLVVDLSDSMAKECADCGLLAGNGHSNDHPFQARINVAAAVLKQFLKDYQTSANGAARYLSVVGYARDVYNPQGVNWVDISGTSANMDELVDKLVSKAGEGSSIGTDTQTIIAMQEANNRLDDEAVRGTHQRSVIFMTDGMPATVIGGGSLAGTIPTADIPEAFQEDYEKLKNYLKEEASNGISILNAIPQAFLNSAAFGFMMREKGAPLYTVSYISGAINGIPPQTMRGWMEGFSDKVYDAGDSGKLESAFTEIIEKLTTTEPETVSDVLPSWWMVDAAQLTGTGAQLRDGRIVWELAKQDTASALQDESYTYQLSYDATLNNLDMGYPGSGKANSVSVGAPTFTYYVYENGSPKGPLRTVKLPEPTVQSFAADLSFTKVDPSDKPIPKTGSEGATFELTIAESDWKRTMVNDKDGVVAFNGIPSGHTYTLTETKAPLEFVADGTKYPVTVAWGTLTSDLNGKTLKNNYDPMEKTVTVQKKWVDSNAGYENETVNFTITCTPIAKAESRAVVEVEGSLTKDNATTDPKVWEMEIEVPTKDTQTGQEMSYIIEETSIPGYTTTYDQSGNTFMIINKAVPTRSITVTKEWVDYVPPQEPDIHREGEPTAQEPTNASRPTITVLLYSGEKETTGKDKVVAQKELTSGETSVTFTDLPIRNSKGETIQYRVGEEPVEGYRLSGNTGNMEIGFTLTNTDLKNDTTDVPVHKHWYDDGDALKLRPDSVTVGLEKKVGDGEWESTGKTLPLTETEALDGNTDVWAGVFKGMPTRVVDDVTKVETPISYRIRELSTDERYAVSYSDNGVDINNTLNTIAVTVRKTWIKPDSLSTPNAVFQLLQNGNPYGETYTMQAPETEHTFTGLPRADGNGSEYVYTVSEDPVEGYTTDATNAPNFTNKIAPVYDVKVVGKINWELRGESPDVLPAKVVIRLYANGIPALRPDGTTVEREATAENGWSFAFEGALRYTLSGYGTVAYSVRELDKDGNPVPDSSTVQFVPAGTSEPMDFGAHYAAVTVSEDGGVFTCDLRNHTDAEAEGTYAVRVNRFYNHYVNGSLQDDAQVEGTEENGGYHRSAEPISLTVNTADYASHNSRGYRFSRGSVDLGSGIKANTEVTVIEGLNRLLIDKADGEYNVNLYYELRETTGGGGGGGGDKPKPTPTPPPTEPPVEPTPPIEPTQPPVEPPTEPTPEPEPPVEPTPTPKPTPPPNVRPTPPVLTPEEQEKVDEVIKDVTEHPDHIIKDKGSFEELYPEISIEDLPPPLYWGPEFAVVEVPVYKEIVAIDSQLVPLGNLPQTGSDLQDATAQTMLVGVATLVAAALGMAASAAMVLWKKIEW